MPLPTIANVYRLAFNWIGSISVHPVNILHVRCTDTSDVTAIVGAIGDAYDAIASGGPFNCLSSEYAVSALQITPLDGVTAATDQPLGTTIVGSGTGDQILNNCGLVSFHTAQRGPRGRGRMYVGPITESKQNGGQLDNTAQTEMLTGWDNWNDELVAGAVSVQLVVASYVHADAHDVASIRIDDVVATQRRRLDQVR